MLPTSLPFILFLLVLLVFFAVTPVKHRWFVLTVGSYLFYCSFKLWYLPVVLAVITLVTYVSGMLIARTSHANSKLAWMWSGIVANLIVLLIMKYLPFIVSNVNSILNMVSGHYAFVEPPLLVSLGVSYFTFQAISYLVEIYLEIIEHERHIGLFVLSLCFFPKLLQGPIERSANLLPQFQKITLPTLETTQSGISLFMWGMFKKVVVADRISAIIDPVFANVQAFSGLPLILCTYLFAIQIYLDFSGYTDMALGVARLFNIRLTQNFSYPYLATSTAEFWRRWHISFSSWILDYIFKPIQFSLRNMKHWGVSVALFAAFLISGIWHGASWNYVIWGGLHGAYLSAGVVFKERRVKLVKEIGLEKSLLLKIWQTVVTFHLVCFAWIFFRVASIHDALYVINSSVLGLPKDIITLSVDTHIFMQQMLLKIPFYDFVIITISMVIIVVIGVLERKKQYPVGELTYINKLPYYVRSAFWGIIVYMIVFMGASTQSFIYQQF